jgi:hypothetical protein
MPMDGWLGGKKSKGGLLLWYWLVCSPPVRLSLSAQCFSLTAKQPQPAYKSKNSLPNRTSIVLLCYDPWL